VRLKFLKTIFFASHNKQNANQTAKRFEKEHFQQENTLNQLKINACKLSILLIALEKTRKFPSFWVL